MNNRFSVRSLLVGAGVISGVAIALLWRNTRYSGFKLKKSIIVDRSPEELYGFWHDFKNLPAFVDLLDSVEVLDDRHSRWTVVTPGGFHVSWEAEITVDRANEMVGWESVKGSAIQTAGYVRFERAPGGRGTMVRIALQYIPPAGKLGAVVVSLAGQRPGAYVEQALRRFKQLMESGEIATASRKQEMPAAACLRRSSQRKTAGPVDEASEESFPASDAPAWTGTTGTGH